MSFEALSEASFSGTPVAAKLHRAARMRRDLDGVTNVYRLHDADADPLQGATIERYADWAVLDAYGTSVYEKRLELGQALLELGARGVYLKIRMKLDVRRSNLEMLAPALPLCGQSAPEKFEVFEGSRRFWVSLADGLSTGLFVDQRDNRDWLQSVCSGARVLNLFAYTGSFSVAAGLGGASLVTTVDLSSKVLRKASENIALNELPAEQHRVLRDDAIKWLARAVRRQAAYEFIIFDPPSFASVGKATFSVSRDYAGAVADAMRITAPSGMLLAVTNHKKTRRFRFEALLREAAQSANRTIQTLEFAEPGLDCPAPEGSEAATKSVRIRLG